MLEIQPDQSAAMRRDIFAERLVEMFQAGGKEAVFDPVAEQVVVKDAKGNPTRMGFDDQGFIGSITSPMGRKWHLDNDPEGKLLGIRNPAGLHLSFDYSEEDDIIRIIRNGQPMLYLDYEFKGYPRSVTFPDDTSTEYTYNDQVKLTDLRTRRGVTEHYEYDADGNLSAIKDGNGNRTQFDYGMWNRPDQARYPDGSTEQYHYNPDGLLQRLISGDTVAEIDYAESGKPKEIRYSDGQRLLFEYNEQGLITKAQNAEITLNYTYDAKGRVLSEERDGQTAMYHYDEIGALAGISYPSGETVEFEYDADNRLTAVKDWQGQYHRFTYLEQDSGVAHRAPNGVTTTVHSSPLGQPLDITVRGRDNRSIFRFGYQYDNEDRVKSFSDSDFGARSYHYDADNQLLGVHSKEKSQLNERFAYDAAGNRTECNGQKAQFNNFNQLVEQGQSRCIYDVRGNLIEYRTPTEVWQYTYDARNQLVRAKSFQGTDVSFGYDAFGRRLWKRSGTRETRFFWLGENLIGETIYENGQEVCHRDNLFLPETFTPFATRIENEIYAYHTDHLETPRRITDNNGRVVWVADYKAFGEASVSLSTIENNLRFPGQYFDVETGLHYNRFRYYSVGLGRYISRDPINFLGGQNLYIYVGNNILSEKDPLGLWWKTALSIAGGVAAGIAVGVAVVALAPAALTATAIGAAAVGAASIIAGGTAAGAVGYGINEALNQEQFCLKCIFASMGKGSIVGFVSSLPFAALPFAPLAGIPVLTALAEGYTGFMAAGLLSGMASYTTDFALTPGAQWSWSMFGLSSGLGLFMGGFGRFIGPRISSWFANRQSSNLAKNMLSTASENEPNITNSLNTLADDFNGKLEGLEFKLKTQESLARKISTDSTNRNITVVEAAEGVKDTLRYTMILGEDEFGGSVNQVITQLEQSGFSKVQVKNTFVENSPYKGVNTVLESPDGQLFELQFHTEQSFNVKQNVNHVLYEEVRLPSTSTQRQAELVEEMIINSNEIPQPNGVEDIKIYP